MNLNSGDVGLRRTLPSNLLFVLVGGAGSDLTSLSPVRFFVSQKGLVTHRVSYNVYEAIL